MHKIIAQKILYALFVNFAGYYGFSMGTEIRDLYYDSYDQKTLKDIGYEMCTKQCITYNIHTCRSYHYDRDNFVCSLNKESNQSSTCGNLWNGERSTIQDTFSSPCFPVSCQRKERCVNLRGGEPKCVIFECDEPPSVPNAVVDSGSVAVTSTRSYTCTSGNNMLGPSYVKCKASGFWTNVKFTCRKVMETEGYHYKSLSDISIYLSTRTSLTFEVESCKDAHIGLFADEPDNSITNFYEIVIGGGGNTYSVIRNEKLGSAIEYVSGTFLNCSNFVQFWVNWENGSIKIGRGQLVGVDIMIELIDPSPYVVNYAAVSSYGQETAIWRF